MSRASSPTPAPGSLRGGQHDRLDAGASSERAATGLGLRSPPARAFTVVPNLKLVARSGVGLTEDDYPALDSMDGAARLLTTRSGAG